jgi:hypothetical protein
VVDANVLDAHMTIAGIRDLYRGASNWLEFRDIKRGRQAPVGLDVGPGELRPIRVTVALSGLPDGHMQAAFGGHA